MKTNELVLLLATGTEAVDRASARRRFGGAVAAGTLAALILMAGLLGLRPTLREEALVPMFWAREAFCLALGAGGLASVARLSRPGSRLGLLSSWFVVPVFAMWALAAASLLAAAPQERAHLILGQTASVCPFLIALLSVPPFVALMWTMRGRAPTQLRLAGAAGGFAAGAVGALVYTLHCPELAAPFLAIWYVLGMLLPTAAGAALGPRLLRW